VINGSAAGSLPAAAGISAMNAINVDIVRSLFMPLFLGGTLAAAALAVMAVLRWGEPGAMVMLAGGVLYVVGMFVVTMVFNVPLNDALAAADPSSPEAASLWARYLKDWTFWNHVRTAAAAGACVLFVAAIAAR
jgi:uncharacterized membrane protein